MKHLSVVIFVLFFSTFSFAEEIPQDPLPELEPGPAAPPPPPVIESGQPLEPEVTIITTEHETIEQYSVDGKIRMVKITPKNGPAYYLVDSDGDGQLDVSKDSIYNASTNMWEILTWD
ncbi:MAG: DUF2782 domain-containing protein [gamma proteobacterium symbiont of Bathyaustriella thionipta]|nr:DUF2782 domain-containing protein [gamma proteobacterium symbiont of Bathyaustriella thionipta]